MTSIGMPGKTDIRRVDTQAAGTAQHRIDHRAALARLGLGGYERGLHGHCQYSHYGPILFTTVTAMNGVVIFKLPLQIVVTAVNRIALQG